MLFSTLAKYSLTPEPQCPTLVCCIMAHGVTGEVSSSLDLLADWKDKLLKGNATPDFANGDSADPVDLNNKIPDASFRDRSGREVSVTPVVVEFRRLIQSGDDGCVVPGVRNGLSRVYFFANKHQCGLYHSSGTLSLVWLSNKLETFTRSGSGFDSGANDCRGVSLGPPVMCVCVCVSNQLVCAVVTALCFRFIVSVVSRTLATWSAPKLTGQKCSVQPESTHKSHAKKSSLFSDIQQGTAACRGWFVCCFTLWDDTRYIVRNCVRAMGKNTGFAPQHPRYCSIFTLVIFLQMIRKRGASAHGTCVRDLKFTSVVFKTLHWTWRKESRLSALARRVLQKHTVRHIKLVGPAIRSDNPRKNLHPTQLCGVCRCPRSFQSETWTAPPKRSIKDRAWWVTITQGNKQTTVKVVLFQKLTQKEIVMQGKNRSQMCSETSTATRKTKTGTGTCATVAIVHGTNWCALVFRETEKKGLLDQLSSRMFLQWWRRDFWGLFERNVQFYSVSSVKERTTSNEGARSFLSCRSGKQTDWCYHVQKNLHVSFGFRVNCLRLSCLASNLQELASQSLCPEAPHREPESACVWYVALLWQTLEAVTSFSWCHRKPNERVMHLTLVAVRKRFQKFGIGKYLLAVSSDPCKNKLCEQDEKSTSQLDWDVRLKKTRELGGAEGKSKSDCSPHCRCSKWRIPTSWEVLTQLWCTLTTLPSPSSDVTVFLTTLSSTRNSCKIFCQTWTYAKRDKPFANMRS